MKLKSEKGFSLIELMIVVAIIGILSAIAIPNFQRFQAKSRQSEARGNLSGYYSASKASFQENGFYPGNFVAIGFNPEGELNYRITAANNAGNMVQFGPDDTGCVVTTAMCTWSGGTVNNWTESGAMGTRGPVAAMAAVAVADNTFLVSASGRVGAAADDEWTITHQKVVDNPQDGLP